MLMLGNMINTLNEKEIKYRLNSEDEGVYAVFGFISQGQKIKVELWPENERILAKLISPEMKLNKDRELDDDGLKEFLDTILKIRAINEEEMNLFSYITE